MLDIFFIIQILMYHVLLFFIFNSVLEYAVAFQ